jgi:16S rRNA (cytosine967-C5)-methyltransferase
MAVPEQKVPLWRQLQATAAVVGAVRAGQSGTAAIDATPAELRPAVQSLAFHVWRNLGRAEALRSQLANKRPPPAADALLCTALALAWDSAHAPYDPFTLVNQAVEAAKRNSATKAQAHFLNACLRRFLREQVALVAATDADLVAQWNHPRWWIERLRREQPESWRDVLQAANTHAPLTLRVNLRKSSVAGYIETLRAAGIASRANPEGAILLEQAVSVGRLPGFDAGVVSVQDAAAQIAAPLLMKGLPHTTGMRVLDACAAPGGKTGHLLEISDAQVLALEVDPQRSARIEQNVQRLGLKAEVRTADALHPEAWWDGKPFDAILLDAPCTASGIVRRHPDVRWLRRETDIEQLAALQWRMLQTLWPLVRSGGRLLYCTCSLFAAEGQTQVQTFLAHNTDAVLLPSPGHLMPQNAAEDRALPDNKTSDHDGFFYALFEKRAT